MLIDIATLDSLPDQELASGISEIIKYGLIRDAPFFEWLEANMGRLLSRDREVWATVEANNRLSVRAACWLHLLCGPPCTHYGTAPRIRH